MKICAKYMKKKWCTQEFCSCGRGGGVQQIQLRSMGNEKGGVGAVAP
jgi:hypothetical protein